MGRAARGLSSKWRKIVLSQDHTGQEEPCQFSVESPGYNLQKSQATWKTKILVWRWQGHPSSWSWGLRKLHMLEPHAHLQPLVTESTDACSTGLSSGYSYKQNWVAQQYTVPVALGGTGRGQFSNLSPMVFEDGAKIPDSALFISCCVQVRATQEDALPISLEITNRSVCFFASPKGRT